MFNKFIIIIMFLLSRGFLLTTIDYQKSNIIIGIICGVFLIFKSKYIRKNTSTFRFDVLIFIFLIIAEIFMSKFRYGQSLSCSIKAGIYYFSILFYYVITYKEQERKTLEFMKKCFIYMSFILSIILILQYYIYDRMRITFIGVDLSRAFRMDGVRITDGMYFISIGIICTLAKILTYKREFSARKFIEYVVFLSFDLFYIVFVSKTRSILVVICLVIVIMMLCSGNDVKKKLLIILVSSIAIPLFLNSSIVKKYIDLGETDTYSTEVRIEAMNYYIDQVSENKLLGVGLIYEKDNHDILSYILHGPETKYFKSDVGIVALYNTFGLFGLGWYILIILKFIRILRRKVNNGVLVNNVDSIGLFSYFIATTPTLNMVSPDLIIYMAIIMAFIDQDSEVVV
ncbi:MAG: hypothetical protein E7213_10860 [Clostridium sp.]|nr:hypothetical protein [Clostridium sp.]